MLTQLIEKTAAARFTREQEMEFVRQYQQTGDLKALKKLNISLRPIIQRVVSNAKPGSNEMTTAQLAIRANSELPAIIKKYNPDTGVALNTFVTNQLGFLVGNSVKENLLGPHVPRPEQDNLYAYRQGVSQAKMEFGSNPTPKQILKFAPKLGNEDEVKRIKQYDRSVLIGDHKQEGEDGGFVTMKDAFGNDDSYTDPTYMSLQMDQLRALMNELNPQERRIIEEYTFKDKSMMDVSLSLGLSSSEVRKTVVAWKKRLQEKGLSQP